MEVKKELQRPDPDTPCAHCGLPVGHFPFGTGPFFCCSGCEIVYDTLQLAGFGDTYYRLQKISSDRPRSKPARMRVDDVRLAELDTPTFIEKNSVARGEERSIDLFLDGVHCAACVWLVEQLPFAVSGVADARLDLPRARLSLRWIPGSVRLSEVARWLARFGYTVHPASIQSGTERTSRERRLLVKLGISWALAGNVMLLAFAFYSGLESGGDDSLTSAGRWMSLVLATPAILYGGSEFYRGGWASVRLALRIRRLRALHIDTPISIGILVGFAQSVWATITGSGAIWFDSITVLIAALLTARWIQLRSRRLAGDATDRLLTLLPTMVRRVAPDGAIETVRTEEVFPGDLVEVPAGEVFPVDGSVESGSSTVNLAVLTGESKPINVSTGDEVQAGATNVASPLRIRTLAAGDDTRVGRLLAWVRNQESRRAPVVLWADRIAGYFVVTVLVLAALTALAWTFIDPSETVTHVVALLVITCPCALGMATPLAMTIAAGRAARRGIFIKNDAATQQLAQTRCIVLDKTGTLTEGRMSLVGAAGEEAAIHLAARLECHSNHPIAFSLRETLRLVSSSGQDDGVMDIEVLPGKGITGYVDNHRVEVGQPAWLGCTQPGGNDRFGAAVGSFSAAGYTPVAVRIDGEVRAVLAFGDRLRPSSEELIRNLQSTGIKIYILSGDHPDVVQHLGRRLGIPDEHAIGNVSPEEKQAFIQDLEHSGRTVTMIGDGVNDAAALQTAGVGIAVYGGSSASMVAADVFLTRIGLRPVLSVLSGARHVMRIIRRNLAISLVYNVLGALAAMTGLVTPLIAAIAMPVSSLIVIFSSVTQRTFPAMEGETFDEDEGERLAVSLFDEPSGHETPRRHRSERRNRETTLQV